jgi:hypothetical protein
VFERDPATSAVKIKQGEKYYDVVEEAFREPNR